jgi:hypothetical protein
VLLISLLVAALGSLPPRAGEGEHKYVGNKKCKMCHLKEWKSWNETKMAQAFEQLKPGERAEAKKAAGLDPDKDYTKDETCLSCHTTGYGKPGGFVNIETTPNLTGVGCEMCHGAGGTYVKSQYMSLKNKEYVKAEIVAAGMVGEITEKDHREAVRRLPQHRQPLRRRRLRLRLRAEQDQGDPREVPVEVQALIP